MFLSSRVGCRYTICLVSCAFQHPAATLQTRRFAFVMRIGRSRRGKVASAFTDRRLAEMSTGPEPAWWAIDWLENRANALEFGDLRPWKMVLRVGLGRLSAMSGDAERSEMGLNDDERRLLHPRSAIDVSGRWTRATVKPT